MLSIFCGCEWMLSSERSTDKKPFIHIIWHYCCYYSIVCCSGGMRTSATRQETSYKCFFVIVVVVGVVVVVFLLYRVSIDLKCSCKKSDRHTQKAMFGFIWHTFITLGVRCHQNVVRVWLRAGEHKTKIAAHSKKAFRECLCVYFEYSSI